MPLLLTMSLFGSFGTLGYIVLLPFAKKYLSVRWRRYYLICNLLEYLVPFPCFQILYQDLLKVMCRWNLRCRPAGNSLFWNYTANVIQIAPNGIYVPNIACYIFIAIIVLTGMVMFYEWMQRYKRIKRFLRSNAECVTTQKHNKMIQEYCSVHKRGLQIYQCNAVNTPFTIGVVRPVIILPCREWTAAELEMVMEHETVHICQWDNLVKMLVLIMVVLNFYSPLAWYVLYQWNTVAELSCDRKVIAKKTKEEIKQYGMLMIGMAEGLFHNASLPIIGFSMQNKMMKERIEQMKNGVKSESTLKKLVGVSVMGIVLFSSSLSVFAYSPKYIEYSSKICDAMYFSEEDAMWGDVYGGLPVNEKGGWAFWVEDTKEFEMLAELNPNGGTYRLCIHDYVSGQSTKHTKFSDNSCKVDYYDSKKCSKCGKVVLGELINTLSYGKCPH
ncbi:MAG: M56 family metallopeptidase [Lachnospiraceae bacterium]|nr:M56 family metallopeptidase [Lachnospiraceae bacterium]